MKYIEAPTPYIEKDQDISLFLAGGITNCPNWQKEIVKLLEDALPETDLVILNPRRDNFPIHDPTASHRQIKWEWDMFQKANLILFWFAKGSINPIVLLEYGKWMTQSYKPIFVGCDPDYPRIQDVQIQTELERPDINITYDLTNLVNQIKHHIQQHNIRDKKD